MATKRAIAGIDEVAEAMPVTEAPKKAGNNDPWSKTERIFLRKRDDGGPNYEIASVNGRVFKIKRGERVDVPAPIAEVLDHSDAAMVAAERFMDEKAR